MIFLDPTSDLAFKKLFGNAAHKNILIDFLNAVLERKPGEKIVDVVFNDPYNTPETPLSKLSIVDVRCTDEKKNQYIIEVQVDKQFDYAIRAQYYSSLALSRQLSKKEPYEKLVPVIFVGILDFNLFKTDNYLSHHLLLDTQTHVQEPSHFEFHFIELKKFTKTLDQLFTVLDRWIYFLEHADTFHTIPIKLKEFPIVHEAFTVIEQGNWSKKELEEYDVYLDSIRSAASILDTACQEGEARGRLEEKIILVKKLFAAGVSKEIIMETTALTKEEFEKIISE